ncbi:MAG TPA: transglutaminase-like domain-containing protein [Methanomassiliicoccales archaeon]|nr:transglutaminase-like domain-containing protein [Methanomassiliicoccales archaeon]
MDRGGRGNALKIAIVLVVILIVVVILMAPSVQNAIAQFLLSPFEEQVPKYVSYRMERVLTVGANGGTIDSFTLDLPLPRQVQGEGYSLQQVLSVTSSPRGEQVLRYGDEWMQWDHGPLAGSQTYVVHVTYQIRVDAHIWGIDEQGSGTIYEVPSSFNDSYLHSEWATDDGWMIDLTSPEIRQQAQEIVGEEKNVYVILERIYQWTVANVVYSGSETSGEPKTALQTLDSRIGDCDDQSILFCSLARAAGVPAWLQLGALYDNSQDEWFGHGWVQAFVPLKGGGSEEVIIDTVNHDFMRWLPDRIVEYTDDGNGDHLSDFYYAFNYYFDETSYPPGQGPTYQESYVSLEHAESSEKVKVGTVFNDLAIRVETKASTSGLMREA